MGTRILGLSALLALFAALPTAALAQQPAATGEGDRYSQRFTTVPGSPTQYPYSAQEFVRVRQGSARVRWQFLENQWIHPYLSAGVSIEEERTRTHVYAPVYLPDPRNPSGRRRRHERAR